MKLTLKLVLLTALLIAPIFAQNWTPGYVENVWPLVIHGFTYPAQFKVAICAGSFSASQSDPFVLKLKTPWISWGTYTANWISGPTYTSSTMPDGSVVENVTGVLLGDYKHPSGPYFHPSQKNVYAYFSDTVEPHVEGGPRTLGCGTLDIVFEANQVIQ